MTMDLHIKKFIKTRKIIILFIIISFYLLGNGLVSFIGNYHLEFLKDYGNLINYTILVPGMFLFLHYSYIFIEIILELLRE